MNRPSKNQLAMSIKSKRLQKDLSSAKINNILSIQWILLPKIMSLMNLLVLKKLFKLKILGIQKYIQSPHLKKMK